MSVTWNMYGGSDFKPADGAPAKKTVTIDTERKQGSPTTVKYVYKRGMKMNLEGIRLRAKFE